MAQSHRHVLALESAWRQAVQRTAGSTRPELVSLTLPKAVSGQQLRVELVRVRAVGLAWAPMPRFWSSDDLNQETAAWESAVKPRRPYFQAVQEPAPDSAIAKAVAVLLNEP